MLGTFQHSDLRIEINASGTAIRDSLIQGAQLRRWLYPQSLSIGEADTLTLGSTFTSWIGPIAIQHQVTLLGDQTLELLMSQSIDGVHEWQWGDGWVQSSLAGVSMLPINLGQTLSLWRLRTFLETQQQVASTP
ncbi:MAG: hypothetical protein EA367_06785 [Leptolyngbya sp. DLM2.Bin15]|nr:MAG: hypothetical protein EA367_06785 [Leptolyngbya sp. DLM2.Bin15]